MATPKGELPSSAPESVGQPKDPWEVLIAQPGFVESMRSAREQVVARFPGAAPVRRSISLDELSPEEQAGVVRGRADIAAGGSMPVQEARDRLDLHRNS